MPDTGPDFQDLEANYEQWSAAAAQVLAKSKRVDVADLRDTPEVLLSTITPDELVIKPLYTRRDELDEPGLPGTYPFVRGSDPARDVNMGWRVTERFGDPTGEPQDPAALNAAILDALNNGASGLWLAVGPDAIAPEQLTQVLDGVLLDLVPVTLDAGADGVAAADAVTALLPDTASVGTVSSFGLSPLTAAYSGRRTVDLDAAVKVAVTAGTGVRAIRVDGTDFALGGATDVQELALVTAAGVDYLRALTEAGLDVDKALAQLTFALSATDDQFGTMAKFRAIRRLWGRVADVTGAPDAGAAVTHGITALGMMSQRDPWVNMLRVTTATFGAGVGGADQITVLPFDAALAPSDRTTNPSFSRRMARNTQLLLLEESNVAKVIDPAGGAWFVESLTDDLAVSAWALFQEIEAKGGYRQALADGWIGEQIATALAARDKAVAHRATALTGINEFPNLAEKPLGTEGSADFADLPSAAPNLARIARPFERLRDRSDAYLAAHGRRPLAILLPLGSVAEHNGRTTFVANLLAAGGIETVNPGPLDGESVPAAVDAAGGPAVAVLCAANPRYETDGGAALAAARAAGVGTVLLAGPPKAWTDSADTPDGFLQIGIDAISTLTELLDTIEAKS
ncbi:methylmalonyl-CoA mutase family protein [Williamsia soli]|uniref:methylmalonyl-CoA mutase family protein n=1 Tax=Williamsia soli TaxID=364929 RepID=UPI001A9F74D9|nr:methylmalonyl-CoA mutase family protein [Williamsia soli]